MTSIYRGCSLNIAVTDAPSCDHGAVPELDDISIVLSSSESHAEPMDIRLFALPEFWKFNVLSSRGWVFQETLVSVSTLFVGHSGLYWECCSASLSEDGDTTVGYIHSINSSKSELADCFQSLDSALRDPESKPPSHYLLEKLSWHKWMASFSARVLTKKLDKLPAVAGLAAQLSRYGLTYAAGIWKESIHVGLTWRATQNQSLTRHLDRAPSWSWASVDGPIEWDRCLDLTKYRAFVTTREHLDMEVSDIAVAEDRPGTFGTVSGGRIDALATLHQLPTGRFLGHLGYTFDESQPFFGRDIWLARVCSIILGNGRLASARQRAEYFFYLILQGTSSGRSEFRRIGLASGEEMLDASEGVRRSIVLI
ncbi:hypothetical protein MFIFM68171_02526 [Madurella fahalii]|uniref:Uncharacterized protein n=1 Tax=Madurella fahalii TaxID=1157608 RepID=A0ABQ0G3I5_9PEZI